MPARITRADVEHVAALARLALTEDELEALTDDLESILGYEADVAELDLADVPPTLHPQRLVNVLRPDETGRMLDRDEVLAQAPAAEEGRFRVPRIMGEAP